MIIGIAGIMGSGKGTVSDILIETYNFKKISFASALKDAVSVIFNWPRHLLEGDTLESREWREQPDSFWSIEMKKPMTPRLVLQLVGTDTLRNNFFDGIWVSTVKQKILEDTATNWVIPDVRFPNEIKMIKDIGGEIWRVKRGVDPDWFEIYQKTGIEPLDVHKSEWIWALTAFDQIIENNETIDDLKIKIKNLI
jgi:hypothetical protein